jgi:hypothetical protein
MVFCCHWIHNSILLTIIELHSPNEMSEKAYFTQVDMFLKYDLCYFVYLIDFEVHIYLRYNLLFPS